LQCLERGSYVSTQGEAPYLDAGAKFFSSYGHPNVKRVGGLEQVIEDRDTGKGHIDKFRLVAHAGTSGLEFGFLKNIHTNLFTAP
jgi:hypothetical protein